MVLKQNSPPKQTGVNAFLRRVTIPGGKPVFMGMIGNYVVSITPTTLHEQISAKGALGTDWKLTMVDTKKGGK